MTFSRNRRQSSEIRGYLSAATLIAGMLVAAPHGASAQSYEVLHSFTPTAGHDLALPESSLIQATDGNLYGTVPEGGANGSGAVFRITTSGTTDAVYAFQAELYPGRWPNAPLVQATDGNFYGTVILGTATSFR